MCKNVIFHTYQHCGHKIDEPERLIECSDPGGPECIMEEGLMGSVWLKNPCETCIERGLYVLEGKRWKKVG